MFGSDGKCGEDAFLVIADLAGARGLLLALGVGEMDEVAAHQPARLAAMPVARLPIKFGTSLRPPKVIAAAKGATTRPQPSLPASSIDGFEKEATYAGSGRWIGLGVMRRFELIVAAMRNRAVAYPQAAHDFEAFLKDRLVVLE